MINTRLFSLKQYQHTALVTEWLSGELQGNAVPWVQNFFNDSVGAEP